MGYFLVQGAFTAEAWANFTKNPQDRVEAVRPVVKALGGEVVGGWFAFGEYDIIAIFQMPDNVSAAAIAIAFSAAGTTRAVKTTPLLTMEEGMEAMRRTSSAGFRPPSS